MGTLIHAVYAHLMAKKPGCQEGTHVHACAHALHWEMWGCGGRDQNHHPGGQTCCVWSHVHADMNIEYDYYDDYDLLMTAPFGTDAQASGNRPLHRTPACCPTVLLWPPSDEPSKQGCFAGCVHGLRQHVL